MAEEDVTSLHTQRHGQFVGDVDQPGQSTKNTQSTQDLVVKLFWPHQQCLL